MEMFARPASRMSIALAAGWGLFFLLDGTIRLLLSEQSWLVQWLGTDVVPHAARIFSGLGWPLGKVSLIVPFLGAWEIAIAMFLIGALYEQLSGDSDDLVPGSAMLILGLAMALTSATIITVVAFLAGQAALAISGLWLVTVMVIVSLIAAISERLAAETQAFSQAPPAPVELFRR
jgi:hypothetical protein